MEEQEHIVREEAPIKKQLVSGVLYTSIAKYSGMVITIVVSAVLARLISPEDFGVVTIATVIISFFSIFSDLGIGPAIIQNKRLNDRDLSSIFTLTVWTGVIISLLFFGASWIIGRFYASRILVPVCQLLSLNLLFASFNIVPNGLILKNKRFRFVAYRMFVIQLICGIIAVSAAFCGAGVYALLINPILSSVIVFIVNYREYPQKLRLRMEKVSLMKVYSFSAYQLLFNVINYFSRNADKLLMGRYINMRELGYYDKSYRLMMLPLQNISFVITPVMHPIFSELQNDFGKLSDSYLKVVKFLSFIGFPLAVVLYFTAKELITLIFGSQWGPSIPVFEILSLSVGIQVILSTSGSIFQAANSTKNMFWCGVFSSIMNVGAICLGIFGFHSMEAVAWCIVASFFVNFVQCYYVMYYYSFKMSWIPFWKSFISPLKVTVLIAVALFLMSRYLPAMNDFVSLMMKGIVSLLILGGYLQVSGEVDVVGKVKEHIHGKTGR